MRRNYWIHTLLLLVFTSFCWANSAPTVTNVMATPRANGIVDISYTLSDADGNHCTVSVKILRDNEGSTWEMTPDSSALSGDVGGKRIASGTRHITWNSKIDLRGAFGSYRVQVIADDGIIIDPKTGMEFVTINDSGAGMKDEDDNPINHGGFKGQMSKYETTNAQYCQYLNAALDTGDITVSGNDVKGANGSNAGTDYVGQSYYRGDGSGYTGNGATNGGASRIHYNAGRFIVDSDFDNHPVTYVNWYGASAFAAYYGYRLPTKWEWQAVADYDGSYIYGCGITITNDIANYWHSTHPNGTTPVGSFGTYGYGLCDMAGNVWEWTRTIETEKYRVLCGGSWTRSGNYCRAAYHYFSIPIHGHRIDGFRVCTSVSALD
ncbi:formylglycine-generating enzyme family protein [Planctomycetota bacterium]